MEIWNEDLLLIWRRSHRNNLQLIEMINIQYLGEIIWNMISNLIYWDAVQTNTLPGREF